MGIILRRTEDRDECQRLHSIIFPSDLWEDAGAYWLAWDGDKTVGFCSARKLTYENGVFLTRAGVLRSYRGRGLQRRMIHIRVAWARSIGVNWAITYATYANFVSTVNLLRSGFRFYAPETLWADKVNYFLREW